MTSPWPGAACCTPPWRRTTPRPQTGASGDLSAARRRMGVPWGQDLTPPGAVQWEQRPAAGSLPPLRLYRAADAPERAPCLLFFHGGGFYGGSTAAVHHPACTWPGGWAAWW